MNERNHNFVFNGSASLGFSWNIDINIGNDSDSSTIRSLARVYIITQVNTISFDF